jgi:endonuclease/exonuclease/phosphatase family metal-dependent hydrolase
VSRNWRLRSAVALIAATALFAGCGSEPTIDGADAVTRRTIGPTEVRVMTFNVWLGGELVDLGKVVEAIRESGADVVGLQEAEGHARHIADLLGWAHVDEQLQIISRFQLVAPPAGTGKYLYVQLSPGQVFAMSNIHLPSDPYGPYLVRDGSSLGEVLNNEEITRMDALNRFVPEWKNLIAAEIPLVVTGDFNTPSHLDWGAGEVGERAHMLYAVDWPVSLSVEGAGLIDTYRSVHRNAGTKPGITWTFGYPHGRLNPNEAADRIDWVLASADTTVLDSKVVGPAGEPDVDVAISPWPSDHNGVVSRLRITPVEPPLFVAVEGVRHEQGDRVTVRYHSPLDETTAQLALMRAGGAVPADIIHSVPTLEASYHGAYAFGTSTLALGEYEVALVSPDGDLDAPRARFWVVAPGSLPSVVVQNAMPRADQPLTIRWNSTPGRKWDWIGVYAADDPNLANYYGYAYTNATVNGSVTWSPQELADFGVEPGEWIVRVMSDDGYVVLAEARFTLG